MPTPTFSAEFCRPPQPLEQIYPGLTQLLHQPERVLEDPAVRTAYAQGMFFLLRELLALSPITTTAPTKTAALGVIDLPRGGTFPARIVERLLQQRAVAHHLVTIEKPAIKQLRQLNPLDSTQLNFEPMLSYYRQHNLPVATQYLLPEDTLDTGLTLLRVMQSLHQYCQEQAALTPSFVILVPTLNPSHANDSPIKRWAAAAGVSISVAFGDELHLNGDQQVPEHGPAHAFLAENFDQILGELTN